MTKSNTKIMRVPANTLRVHPTAQRAIVPSQLKKMLNKFDPDGIGVIHVVQYEIGGIVALWIIDGQHRWKALMERSLGEWLVTVQVYLDVVDDARASALFLELNDRSVVSTFATFQNEVNAGHPIACGVLKLATDRKFRIHREPGDGNIRCIVAMKKVYAMDDGLALGRALDTLMNAWGRTEAAVDGAVVEGLGLVYATYGDVINQPALTKRLAKHAGGAAGLLGDARAMRKFRVASTARCVAAAAIELYNAGRRSGRLDPL